MRLKVLPLDTWMCYEITREDCLESDEYQPFPVRFNRPGIYLETSGKEAVCWFELDNGCAYSYPVATFQYTLKLHNAWHLNQQQVVALQAIVATRLATRSQRELLRNYLDAWSTRAVYRNSRKHMLRFESLRKAKHSRWRYVAAMLALIKLKARLSGPFVFDANGRSGCP